MKILKSIKMILAISLAIFNCLFLFSCNREPNLPLPNTTREEGFPESAEVLYDTVEGTRIPFKSLGVLRAGTKDSQMLVLRSADEVNTAIEQGYFSFIGEEGKALLLSKNYDLYQIVAVRYTGGAPYREVAELVVSGGALEVVRVRYIHPLGHYADVHYDEYALCLVQKSDITIPAPDPFSLHLIEHLIELPTASNADAQGVPYEIETMFAEVEGTRIPFAILGTCTSGVAENEMLVLQSAEDVDAAITQGIIAPDADCKQMLLQKEYSTYAVLGIRYRGEAPYHQVTELVNVNGALRVVCIRMMGDKTNATYDTYTLCLVRRAELNLQGNSLFDLPLDKTVIDLS